MRVLTYTTLFPNSKQIRHGIFIEQRLKHFLTLDKVEALVVAPVPWFPFQSNIFGQYSLFSQIEDKEEKNGVRIFHPRYLVIPKIGMLLAPLLLTLSTYFFLKKIIKDGYDFDVIDAHYFYPDGVAAAFIGKLLKKPVVISARGSDVNLIPDYYLPKKMIVWAASHSQHIITVSQALKNKLEKLGINENKIDVIRNGVNLQLFSPDNREKTRKQLKISKPTVLCVGNLVKLKGHDLVIQAIACLHKYNLIIVGSGEELNQLKQLCRDLNIAERVTFKREMTQSELVELYKSVDFLVHASSREGWPNVLLEAMACGTPVIATRVGGIPEVVTSPAAGILINERTPKAIKNAIEILQKTELTRSETRKYAEMYSWDESINSIFRIFSQVINKYKEKK